MKWLRVMGYFLGASGLIAAAAVLYQLAKPPDRAASSLQLALPERSPMAMEGRTRVTSTLDGKVVWTMLSDGIVFTTGDEDIVTVAKPRAWVPVADGGTVEVSGLTGGYFRKTEDLTLSDSIQIMLDKQGRREWVLDGDTGSYRKAEEAFYLSGVSGRIFPQNGDTLEVEGSRGRYDTRARTMNIRGTVVCRYSKGITLSTEELNYNVEREEAATDKEVTVTGKDFKLTGIGLLAEMKTKHVTVERSVKVRLEKGMGGVQ